MGSKTCPTAAAATAAEVDAVDCIVVEDVSGTKEAGDGPRFKKHDHKCLLSSLGPSWSVPQRLQVFSPAPVWLRM